MKYAIILSLVTIIIAGCKENVNLDDDQERLPKIQVMDSKIGIREKYGEPQSIENIVKDSEQIFGPEENFWHKIPLGATLEVWGYINGKAAILVYFENGSEFVNYISLHHQDMVY